GRGADIYAQCRVSLLQIGKPAVQPLIDAHEHKNAALEADAKKYEFRPGVIEQKTSLMLGDLRAKEAIPVMQAELKKPTKGDNHLGALIALGMIADPSTTKDLTGVLTDAKRDFKVRISAAEALNLAGDPTALPTLLQVAKTGDVVKDKQKYPDVRLAAAMSYARLGGAAEAAAFAPVAAAEKAAPEEFKEDASRLEVAKKCGKDATCYATVLATDASLPHQEKAAFMLSRMGKAGMPGLVKKLSTREPIVRQAVLFGIGKIGDKSSTDALKALDAQIDVDRTKPPMRALVEEMRAVRAMISNH
ncbi:MAG TPA: HEAT repeat domain-containing protein, partial [Polyangia bacterium]